MLFILIPITWLAILTVFVALCRAAAQGDVQMLASAQAPSPPIGIALKLSRRTHPHARALRQPRAGYAASATARGGRARGARCAAGS
jgi:hypothetical protein